MTDNVIQVKNLSKRYVISHQPGGTGGRFKYKRFSDVLVNAAQAPFRALQKKRAADPTREEFWALKDVSFTIKRGESVGIIGRNGAGKSTLLKILSRITEPSGGRIEIEGRVASLLEVGTGFHPELTGRENIYLNGAILGMKRSEIRKKFDEIVAFAEVEKFLDTPVKHFSSGMYMRLAFAVAAHLESEILIVDEVLAVGDAEFQKKCLGKMQDVSTREGRTVIFVSHNVAAISALCTSAILLVKGQIETSGETSEVLSRYLQLSQLRVQPSLNDLRISKEDSGVRLTAISLRDGKDEFGVGEDIVFKLTVTASKSFKGISLGCSLFHQDEACIGTLFTSKTFDLEPKETKHINLTIRRSGLAPGSYFAGFSLGHGGFSADRRDYDIVLGAPRFQITALTGNNKILFTWPRGWGGIIFTDHELTVTA